MYLSKVTVFTSVAYLLQPSINLALVSWGFEINLFNGLFFYKPWRLFLLISSLLPIFCGFVIFHLPESPKLLLAQGKTEESLAILKYVYKTNGNKGVSNIIILRW